MSDSRLEKFIYAVCSMDVSDLPIPLSRIEKLWNCLITGETPDFEPLSRNEKYLMAMLDRYDLNNLPAPMSRGEKLLYKIAVGETDLSDVPGYLSRYEELLKYLIENGGISGGDFEYVLYAINQSLYTLYTTAEKPVKSAILKGSTEIIKGKNLFNELWEEGLLNPTDGSEKVDSDSVRTDFIEVEESKTYVFNKSVFVYYYEADKGFTRCNSVSSPVTSGTPFKTKIGEKYIRLFRGNRNLEEAQLEIGNVCTTYEPYIEPILQSVKMPVLTTYNDKVSIFNQSEVFKSEAKGLGGSTVFNLPKTYKDVDVSFKKIFGNLLVRLYKDDDLVLNIDENTKRITQEFNQIAFRKVDEGYWVANGDGKESVYEWFENGLVELNMHSTNEKLYPTLHPQLKTNILTVNEDVTLRSNGNICDELNLLTGQLTQRIDEDGEVLSQEVVKTVDLTTVDQDGQPTKLKTFNDITYVEIKADNLIPSVDVEVATKINEALSTMGPQQLDISETQNKLGQTIDEQTKNTDATMMATTEIYEQTL